MKKKLKQSKAKPRKVVKRRAPVKRAENGGGDRDEKGRLKPGHHIGASTRFGSGQPTDHGGRPAGPSLGDALRKAFMQIGKGGKAAVEEFAEIVVQKCLEGDTKAWQFGADRAFGTVEQSVKVTETGQTKIEYVNDWRGMR